MFALHYVIFILVVSSSKIHPILAYKLPATSEHTLVFGESEQSQVHCSEKEAFAIHGNLQSEYVHTVHGELVLQVSFLDQFLGLYHSQETISPVPSQEVFNTAFLEAV